MTFGAEVVAAEARVALADAALEAADGAAGDAAEGEALAARRALVRVYGVGLLDRGAIPGLGLVYALNEWLCEYENEIGREALDALAARMKGGGRA